MKVPVTASDGHTYEKEALVTILNGTRKSPQTREPLLGQVEDLKKNIIIARLIEEFVKSWTDFEGRHDFPDTGDFCEGTFKDSSFKSGKGRHTFLSQSSSSSIEKHSNCIPA